MAIALACDLRLCTDKAKMGTCHVHCLISACVKGIDCDIGITFVQLGLHPGSLPFLRLVVSAVIWR